MRFFIIFVLFSIAAFAAVKAKKEKIDADGTAITRRPFRRHHNKNFKGVTREGKREKRDAEAEEENTVVVEPATKGFPARKFDKKFPKGPKFGKGRTVNPEKLEAFRAKFAGRTVDPAKLEEFRAKFAGRTGGPKNFGGFRGKFGGRRTTEQA